LFRIIIAGDFNQTKKAWLASSLSLNQIVNIPTHSSGSTLDLILTNTEDLYHPPHRLDQLACVITTLYFSRRKFCEKTQALKDQY